MPNSAISGLPAGGAVTASTPFPTDQAGVTVQVPASALLTFVNANSPLLVHPGYVSGRTYSNGFRVGAPGNITAAANTVYYSMLQIWQATAIASFRLRTGTTNAVAANANIGLYTNTTGAPNALFNTVATGVAIPAAINSLVTITAGAPISLAVGVYWFAVQMDAGPQMVGDATLTNEMTWLGTNNASGFFASTNVFAGFTEAAAFAGGLPVTATPVASLTGITTGAFTVN